MAHRVADELIRRLAEAGVERIYGVVGAKGVAGRSRK